AVYFLAAGYSPALAALSLAVVPAVLIPYPSQVAPGILLAGLSVALLVQAVPPVFGGKRFTISDARRLGEAFDARTAPGSLVVCARYLKQNIDVYSHCVALNPNQISSPFGLTPAEAVRVLIRDGVEVYALDNKGKRKAARFVEQLRDYFDLRPVYRWRSADLNIDYPQFSEREFLTLFRVLPWSAVPVVLQPGPGTSGAAVFDARYPWWTGDRDYIRATADGAPLEGEVLDGYNYLKFPSAGSAVEFASDRGLPAFRILRGFEPDGSISLPFGSSSGIEDWKLLDDGFFREPGGKQWRTLSGKGAVRIPPFRGEGATVSLRVRPRGGAARLALALEGKPLETVDLGPGDWRELVVPVPPATAEVGAARLELEVLSDDGAPARLDLGAVRMTAGRGE
ncbi:MAG TPA: hypothetical protein PK636_03045, partial [bacterium]|nr:hypothetical protein [bacterium]